KTSIECGNNSRLIASTTSSSNIRGFTVNLLYLDEFAFVNNATQFFTSSYPTITAGQTSKIIISSTFNGLNLFYYLWMGAKAGENGFYPFEVNWWEVPGRDEKWKEEQIAVLGEEKFRQEYGNEAIGSTHTLIAASYLKQIRPTKGKRTADGYEFIEDPIENHSYVVSCDVARGTDNDYSVAIVVDVTSFPFKIVATFVDNQIRPVMFPDIIYKLAKKYNDAYVLIERNANGQDVVDILVNEYEYDNIFSTKTKTKVGQILSLGVGGRWIGGVEMTKNVKRIGCFVLKSLIEEQKLINITEKILNELYTFSKQRETYKAEPGNTDDCVMALVLFSWVVNQPFFKDMFNADFRKEILTKYMKENEEEDRVTPLFIHDGKTSYELEEFGF
ncbi:MAG: terminase family protein, partial [Patescibacteria group bacterium]|nr:terminase family protein [Patescibacteria group bacterium]